MKKFIVLFAVLAMVFAFTAQAMADVSLYGSARFLTYSVKVDKEQAPGATYDDTDTEWTMAKLGRFGAKFTGGDVTGLWEIDARNTTTSKSNDTSTLGSIRIRHLFGSWNFGSGQLLIGQTWPLTDMLQSGLAYKESGLEWWGGMGTVNGRHTQLRLTFGDLAVAFLTPQMRAASAGIWGSTDTDVTLPKIEVRYDLKLEPVKLAFVGGWQKYEEVNATDQTKDITSWVVAGQAKTNFGAAYVNLVLHYSQNEGDYGLGASSIIDDAYMKSGGTTDIEDVTTWGAALVVGFKVSDMVTLEAGYGKLKAEGDNYTGAGLDLEDDAQAYYLQCNLTMAPGVHIKPEIAVFDKEDRTVGTTTTEEGKTTVVGVFWQIDFK